MKKRQNNICEGESNQTDSIVSVSKNEVLCPPDGQICKKDAGKNNNEYLKNRVSQQVLKKNVYSTERTKRLTIIIDKTKNTLISYFM